MKSKKPSRIDSAIAESVNQVSKPVSEATYYDESDTLKHFIRKSFWKKRIERLKRDNNNSISEGVKYFSFCSRKAFDVRYFLKEKLIDLKRDVPFAFVEIVKQDYDFLRESLLKPAYRNALGFEGRFADIATNSKNSQYGSFWGSFPFDVINLDYLGDIFRTNAQIGESDFYAIESIVHKQFSLRRSYELWLTVRAKSGRFEHVVKNEFVKLIKHNLNNNSTFENSYKDFFPGISHVEDLDDDNLFVLGFLKWLWYVCKSNYSVVNSNKSEVIRYGRNDKDRKPYYLYNIFLRIEPYGSIVMTSPSSEAHEYCEAQYKRDIQKCLCEAIDVDEQFKSLAGSDKNKIEDDLKWLLNKYQEDEAGFIG